MPFQPDPDAPGQTRFVLLLPRLLLRSLWVAAQHTSCILKAVAAKLPGVSPDHEMGVYGEVAKFLWFMCDSIKEEPDACYVMASEFATIGVPIMMIMEPEWTFKKAQIETMQVYKTVIPQYLLASQKLDFLCFTEGLYKISERYLPDACAEDRALW